MRCTTKRKPPPSFILFEDNEATRRAIGRVITMVENNSGNLHEHMKILTMFARFIEGYYIEVADWNCFLMSCATRILKYVRASEASHEFKTDLCKVAVRIPRVVVQRQEDNGENIENLTTVMREWIDVCLEYLKDGYQEERRSAIVLVIVGMNAIFSDKSCYPEISGPLAIYVLCMPETLLGIFKYITNPGFDHSNALIEQVTNTIIMLVFSIPSETDDVKVDLEAIFRPTMDAMETFIPPERVTPQLFRFFCAILNSVAMRFQTEKHPLADPKLRASILEWVSQRLVACAYHKDSESLVHVDFSAMFLFLFDGNHNELLEKATMLEAFEILLFQCPKPPLYVHTMFAFYTSSIGGNFMVSNLQRLAQALFGCMEALNEIRNDPSNAYSDGSLIQCLTSLSVERIELFYEMSDTQLSSLVQFSAADFKRLQSNKNKLAEQLFVFLSNLSTHNEVIALNGINCTFGEEASEKFKRGSRIYSEVCTCDFIDTEIQPTQQEQIHNN